MLTRPPKEYRIGDVLRAVEGSLAPITCLQSEINQCERCDQCDTLDVYKRQPESMAPEARMDSPVTEQMRPVSHRLSLIHICSGRCAG